MMTSFKVSDAMHDAGSRNANTGVLNTTILRAANVRKSVGGLHQRPSGPVGR
jgi:hypothetical protein